MMTINESFEMKNGNMISSSFLSNDNQDREGHWPNELRSLDIHPKEKFSENEDNSLSNSIEELANHVETIKQILY